MIPYNNENNYLILIIIFLLATTTVVSKDEFLFSFFNFFNSNSYKSLKHSSKKNR